MKAGGVVGGDRTLWRIVIVDDCEDDRAEIRRMLLKGSERLFRFREAETGAAAIAAVLHDPSGPPDCLLIDYYLPDMDAIDVLAALMDPSGHPVCPVVVLTGSIGAETGRAVLRAGAQDYVGKDWLNPSATARAVENAVERYAMTLQLRAQEAAIRESETRLRLALEASDTGLWTWDLDTDAVTWTPQGYRLLGRSPDSYSPTGTSCLEMVHPDDRDRVRAALEQAIGEGVLLECEYRVVRPDGSILWVGNRARCEFGPAGRPCRMLGTLTDITVRKQAEESLRRRLELQEQLARIAERVPGGIYSFQVRPDGSTCMPFSTPPVADILGFSQEQLADDLGCVDARIDPQDLPRFKESVGTASRTLSPWHDVFRYHHPTRGMRWIEGWSSPKMASDGTMIWHGFAMDVTEREQAEASRRESERLAHAILDSMSSFVAVIGEHCEVLTTNLAWREAEAEGLADVFGLSDRASRRVCEIMAEEIPSVSSGVQAVLRRECESIEVECELTLPDGVHQYIARVTPFSGPGPRRVVVSFQDVTELKLAHERLRESEERFRTLADGISQFAWMADGEGRISWYNKRWYEYTGAEPGAPLGDGWTRFIHPDHLDRLVSGLHRLQEGVPWEETYPIRSRSGDYRWFLSRAMPVRDDQGKLVRWFGTNTDITERMTMEAALTENDRRKDLFLAMLGHELRNPLATIRVAGEVLGTSIRPDQAEWARDVIRGQVDHLARLLDDLLDISRITRGSIRIEPQPIDARGVVSRAIDAMRPLIEARGHRLDLRLGDQPLGLLADPDRLDQVLVNLVSNAAKYTPPGGRIEIEAGRRGGAVVLRVQDSGMGIARDDLPRLFDPFVQGKRTLDRSEGGLGIGLTIANELVRLHGGRIDVASEGPGQGSEFVVVLPAAEPPPDTLQAPCAQGRPASCRVLIVDDNRELARGLGQLLEALGHRVRLAFDGPSGIEAVRDDPPDILLLDLGLPIVDGYEVARTLRADPTFDAVTIIAVSGYAQEEDRKRSEEVGINHHIAKPVDLRALVELIKIG